MEIKPCPFCGCRPKISLAKKTHCQLHGEPSQAILIYCDWKDCSAKPRIEAGNIYNGIGDVLYRDKETKEAIEVWNTRTPQILESDLPAKHAIIPQCVESDYTRGVIEGSNSMHDQFTTVLRSKGVL